MKKLEKEDGGGFVSEGRRKRRNWEAVSFRRWLQNVKSMVLPAPHSQTTQEKNVGRRYYTCQRCRNFFMWEEHYKLCKCGGDQCKVRTATTVTNKGRPFWCCPQSTGVNNSGCGIFD
ncbi:hypothetical protein NE237_032581 [Protea cynaroides]|uniref:GRF-type domain-containing protein n=1 Tax=Protea cynaroides TaxID=273540 RepID=A0A9Q0L4H7_9MAGN|nr:hypothetical protein NE237_032581 [Protea cynaroides]